VNQSGEETAEIEALDRISRHSRVALSRKGGEDVDIDVAELIRQNREERDDELIRRLGIGEGVARPGRDQEHADEAPPEDLKAVLLDMSDVGEDADFQRLRGVPKQEDS